LQGRHPLVQRLNLVNQLNVRVHGALILAFLA
jgi:hypothetical protein